MYPTVSFLLLYHNLDTKQVIPSFSFFTYLTGFNPFLLRFAFMVQLETETYRIQKQKSTHNGCFQNQSVSDWESSLFTLLRAILGV